MSVRINHMFKTSTYQIKVNKQTYNWKINQMENVAVYTKSLYFLIQRMFSHNNKNHTSTSVEKLERI